ncbi:MAG TPA: DUF2167 domain-containing protein, partial [Phaeodactylibacter sp.]|nr:DUF2167 domain-containing protein [Phaeodactylibacter sp.]
NIRILGRKGYLQLNAISDITTLPVVENDIDLILASVDFNSGNKYADFTPGIDKVAAIGIGGLIAGKVLAKAGFFVVLLKFWKIFAIGFVAFFGRIKNFFLGRKIKPAETSTEDEV